MKRNVCSILMPVLLRGFLLVLVAPAVFAQDPGLVARWTFDEGAGPAVLDSADGLKDAVEGHFKFVPGVAGSSLKFDGNTTRVIRQGNKAPRLGHGGRSLDGGSEL